MTLAHAMWTHGTSVQIEYPDRLDLQRRAGSGAIIGGRSGTDNWCHFAIPTPVIVEENRLTVGSVMLIATTASADSTIKDVHIYDGGHRIATYDGVDLSGSVGFQRFDVPDHPEVRAGIGLSVRIAFGVESMPHEVVFVSAGCDFTP